MNKQLYIICIFCLASFSLFAQKRQVQNQPYGDQRLYHFGLTFGMNFPDMILTNTGSVNDDGEIWYGQIPNYSPGFSVGVITDLYLNPYMNLRFTPTLHFSDRLFYYKEEALDKTYKTTVRSNSLTFPLDVKISAMRLNNYRPYLLAGVFGAIDLGRKKGEAMLLKPIDYGVEIGFGCDFYLPIVKVCPEIKFCFGFADLIDKNRTDLTDKDLMKYSQVFNKGISRMIVVSFNFE